MKSSLDEIDFDSKQFPVRTLLTNSIYYPASGLDGDPVRFIGNRFQSFVYVDYGISRDEVNESIYDTSSGFRGYQAARVRSLNHKDLCPNGWETGVIPDKAWHEKKLPNDRIQSPFIFWALFERKSDFDEDHGPERFSLLYIGGDGVATFRALYHGNKVSPAVVCIIQPGTGFGGNWTDFCDPCEALSSTVMDNPAGAPQYMLYGGWGPRAGYRESCWPYYNELVEEFEINAAEGGLFLFRPTDRKTSSSV